MTRDKLRNKIIKISDKLDDLQEKAGKDDKIAAALDNASGILIELVFYLNGKDNADAEREKNVTG